MTKQLLPNPWPAFRQIITPKWVNNNVPAPAPGYGNRVQHHRLAQSPGRALPKESNRAGKGVPPQERKRGTARRIGCIIMIGKDIFSMSLSMKR